MDLNEFLINIIEFEKGWVLKCKRGFLKDKRIFWYKSLIWGKKWYEV